MTKAKVRCGSEQGCCDCDGRIAAGSLAFKSSRRAVTYRERCYADQHGKVSWYLCIPCSEKAENATKE